jgi:hypothetical protein
MRYDRSNSKQGVSVAYHSGPHALARILGFELVQLAQAELDLWRYLWCLVGRLIGLDLLVVVLLLAGILRRAFRGQRFLLWSRSPCPTRLVILFSYNKLWVEF